ncbi:MAG TPA: sensor histidine kinase, partial [Spirochaetia bacterium]|nr:sensor histidine kinase [Spirochaetia bacterium]
TRGKKARMALERSREELRSLASHLQALREEERTRVAREVHDELGGLLTTLKMELSLVARRGSRNSCQEEYHSALELIEQSLAMIHRIAADLRPVVLDDFGLFPALEWYLRDFQKRTGISCDLRADPVEWTLDRSSAASLFRVVQEALTNVARHAHATTVTVDLHREGGRLRVSVEDNGVGIDEARLANTRSYGLIGIRERVLSLGGELAIRGAPGRGTTVSLSIPEGVLGGTP